MRYNVGMFSDDYKLHQVTYQSVKHCKDLCSKSIGCKAIAISPRYWAHRECFLVSDNEIGPRRRWTSSIKCGKDEPTTTYTVTTQTSERDSAGSDDINLTITVHGKYGDVTTM